MMAEYHPVVWGDGKQTRDFIFVEDAALAFKMAMEDDDLSTCELNLGFGIEHSFLDVISIVGKELGFLPEPTFVDVPIQIYAYRLWADTRKIERDLGFRPAIDLSEGIRRIIQATNELPADVRKTLNLGIQQLYYENLADLPGAFKPRQ